MISSRREWLRAFAVLPIAGQDDARRWPSFRGLQGKGVSTGHPLLSSWNADPAAGPNAGPAFEVLACNRMGEPRFATPAIQKGTIYFRTTDSLVAVG